MRETSPRLQIAVVFVVAALISGAGSARVSFWTDEAYTISVATRTWEQMWAVLGRIDAVHGLYYAFMSPWIDLFGQGEVALRFPSALAAGGTAAGVLVVARRMTTSGTALLAALLCAMLPRLTWAGIEARPFVFSALLAVWATWAFLVVLEKGGAWRWARYAALSVVGVLSNIYLVMLVMGHGVTMLVLRRSRRSILAYLVAASATAVVSLPLLLLVQSQQTQLGTADDPPPSIVFIMRRIAINQLFLGETPSDGSIAPWAEIAWQVAAVLAAIVAAAITLAALLLPARSGDAKGEVLAVAVPWIAIPTLIVAAYAVIVTPIYQPRYFTFTVPAAALVLALGLRALPGRKLAASTLVVLLVSMTVVYASQRLPQSKPVGDWAAAASVVQECADSADAVLFVPLTPGDVATRTTRRIQYAYPQAFVGLHDLTLIEGGVESATLDGYSAPLSMVRERLEGYETVWVIYDRNSPDSVVTEDAAVLEDEGFVSVSQWQGSNTTVVEYSRLGSIDDTSRPASCPTV